MSGSKPSCPFCKKLSGDKEQTVPDCPDLKKGGCEAEDGGVKNNASAMGQVYQVTARLLSAEQTTAWTRTAGFIALGAICAAVLKDHSGACMQTALGVGGLLLSVVLWCSLERSFDFRDHFANLMRAQEKWLGLEKLGPLTTGKEGHATSGSPVSAQRSIFRMIMGVLAAGFGGLVIHGVLDALGH